MPMKDIAVIAFDADDTLWVNEPYFRASEDRFCDMMSEYLPHHDVSRELLAVEIKNIPIYGYGIKAFIISMIETATVISSGTISAIDIQKIINIGRDQLAHPITLIDGVEEVLIALQGKYKLVMATKGDLKEQEEKLIKSGLEHYFHHIEILSEKKEVNYTKLIKHLDILPERFMMIGNSLKSDIIPILDLGGWACHIPFHTTWEYEKVDAKIENDRFRKLTSVKELPNFI